MTLNKPSPRLAILRAQLAAKAEAEQLQRDTMRLMALAPIRCKAPAPDAAALPLPPSYWDDLEHWLKTLAPAKPAAPQPEPAARLAFTSVNGQGYFPTQQPAQKASTHLVCIEDHSCKATGMKIHVGRVSIMTETQLPDCWLPCDKDGWIPHTPTADSTCPVPDGVKFEARYGDGTPVASTEITRHDCVILWRSGSQENTIIAWRPIADGVK